MAIDRAKIEVAESILVNRQYALELFASQGPFKPSSQGYLGSGTCPSCGGDRFWISLISPHCGCWKPECGYKAGWYTYLQRTRGYDWPTYARHVADAAGVDLELDPADEKHYQDTLTKDKVLRIAQELLSKHLWADSPELAYLRSRGYSDEQISGMGAGSYPPVETLQRLLADRKVPVEYYTPKQSPEDALDPAGLMTYGFGTTHTLTFPIHDPTGKMLAFTVRTIQPGLEPKYKYKHSRGWKREDGLPGMNLLRGRERVLMVESVIGAKLLMQYDIPVVPVAGLYIPPEIFRQLKYLGVKELVFAYDNEPQSRKAKRDIIARLPKGMEREMSLFMANLPDGVKAPDDLCLLEGPEAVKALFDSAQTYASWQGWDAMQDIDLINEVPRERALRTVAEGYDRLKKRDGIMAQDYLKAVMGEARHELDPVDVEARITGKASTLAMAEALRGHVKSADTEIPALVRDKLDILEGRVKRGHVVPTGVRVFDDATGGLQAGWLSLFVAPEKSGKSKVSFTLACKQAEMGHRVGIISMDMSRELTYAYIGSSLAALANKDGIANVSPRDLMQPISRDKLMRFSTHRGAAAGNLFVVTEGVCNMQAISAYAEMMAGHGCEELVLDQAMFIQEYDDCKSAGDHRRICNFCKELAGRLGISVRLLHQANRAGHTRTRRRDIFGSSVYAMVADVIFLLTDKQSGLCESDKSPGFVLVRDSGPEYMHDCRAPHIRDFKWQEEGDLQDNIKDEPFPQRLIEIEMQGRVPRKVVRLGFDYVAGEFLE